MIKLSDFVKDKHRFIAAHRGASGYTPENTMAAFAEALACGASMVEADIQITSDFQAVVFHDDSLGRTAKGNELISSLKYSDIKDLSAGEWFSSEYSNEKIPLLSDLLEFIGNKSYLSLEIKPANDLNLRLSAILDVINHYDYMDSTVFASFDYCALTILKQKSPASHIAAVKLPGDDRLPSQLRTELDIEAFICSIDELNDDIAEDVYKSDLFLGVYAVDTPELFQRALNYPVQAFGTNFPCLMAELLAKA